MVVPITSIFFLLSVFITQLEAWVYYDNTILFVMLSTLIRGSVTVTFNSHTHCYFTRRSHNHYMTVTSNFYASSSTSMTEFVICENLLITKKFP